MVHHPPLPPPTTTSQWSNMMRPLPPAYRREYGWRRAAQVGKVAARSSMIEDVMSRIQPPPSCLLFMKPQYLVGRSMHAVVIAEGSHPPVSSQHPTSTVTAQTQHKHSAGTAQAQSASNKHGLKVENTACAGEYQACMGVCGGVERSPPPPPHTQNIKNKSEI